MFNIDTCRSYATEENLTKAIAKLFGDDVRYLVVCNRTGRFTAVFSLANNNIQGDVTMFARHGFMTMN